MGVLVDNKVDDKSDNCKDKEIKESKLEIKVEIIQFLMEGFFKVKNIKRKVKFIKIFIIGKF